MKSKRKKILIFDTEATGHHVEYIHHLLLKANNSSDDYIFCIPSEIIHKHGKELDWTNENNVDFSFIDSTSSKSNSRYKEVYQRNKLLKHQINEIHPTNVFLVSLVSFLPFLPFMILNKVKISGIIYQIYLFKWNKLNILQKIKNIVLYILLTKCKIFDKLYILNSSVSVRKLNGIYHTNKFQFLPDPYVPLKSSFEDLKTYNLDLTSNIFFHFGAMTNRKGTLEILKCIKYLNTEVLNKTTFIFAGKVGKDIKLEFYSLLKNYKQKVNIVVIDEFCSYELISSLCSISHVLLMPYKIISQSTGIIGYAAQFRKPVLAPSNGLIGKLVRNYHLGYTLDNCTPENIANFINNFNDLKSYTVSDRYLINNNVNSFLQAISFD